MAAAMLEEAAHITRLRFGDIVNVNGHDIDTAKLVKIAKIFSKELKKRKDWGWKLEKDMKSESGLFVTFPLAFLMSGLR